MPAPLLSRTWIRVLAGLLLLGAIFLIGTPYLIRHLLKNWLLTHGGERVAIAEVNFNPFLGRLRLGGLRVQAAGRPTLAYDEAILDLEWLPLFQRHTVLQSLILHGLRMEVDNRDELLLLLGGIRVEKKAEKAAAGESRSPGPSWAGSIQQLVLEDIKLDYRDKELTLHAVIDHLQLQHLAQWTPKRPAALDLQGTINDAPLRLQARLMPFAAIPTYEGHLEMQALGLDTVAAYARDTFPTFAGKLSLGVDFQALYPGNGLELIHQGHIRLDDLRLATKDWSLEEKRLEWNGEGRTELATALKSRSRGRLEGEGLVLRNATPAVTVSYGGLEWEGRLALDTAGESPRLKVQARTTVKELDFIARDSKTRLGSFETLELSGLDLKESGDLDIGRIDVRDLRLGQRVTAADAPAAAQIGLLRLSDIHYTGNTLRITRAEEQDLVSTIVRGKNGDINMVRLVDAAAALGKGSDEGPSSPPREQGGQPLQVVIDRISVTGDSRLRFIDQSVHPTFTMAMKVEKAEFASIDTAHPRQASTLDIRTRSGKYTTLTATGTIKPLLDPPQMDITVQLKAMDLYPLTPYTRDGLGLILKSGSLDMDMRLLTRDQRMDGNIVLLLHQFEVESADVENSLQSQIPLPLDVALDALRDRNNIIRLRIPVTGDPTSPDFSFNDVLRKALTKGVSKGALTYLSYALQPYGTLVAVARYAGEEVSRVRLKAVEFAPGDTTLDEEDKDYLAKVARILSDRPKLSIKLCGVATARDLAALRGAGGQTAEETALQPTEEERDALRELAVRRATAVESYLVEAHQADASRLVGCQPRLELDNAAATPRTDLLI